MASRIEAIRLEVGLAVGLEVGLEARGLVGDSGESPGVS